MNNYLLRQFEYHIPNEYQNHKISEFLHHQGYSRQYLTTLRHTPGCILKNGVEVHMNQTLSEGDLLCIRIYETESPSEILPVTLPLQIIYEDEDFFVINKPGGMPIHPSRTNPNNSLANAVAALYQSRGVPFVYRCVNRLDKDTTGLTILAKHPLSASVFYEMVKTRAVERTYFAIVDCSLKPIPAEGIITLPISKQESTDREYSIKRYVDMENGAPAVTHYKTLATDNNLSLLELHLETGRTHQIRVHMSTLGFPLIGDRLYHPNNQQMSRQALHAGRLEFTHPFTGEHLSFTAALPEDMKVFPVSSAII